MMKGSYRLFICLLTALNISIARAQVNDTIPSQRTDTLSKPIPSSVITDEIRQEPYDLLQLADDIARTWRHTGRRIRKEVKKFNAIDTTYIKPNKYNLAFMLEHSTWMEDIRFGGQSNGKSQSLEIGPRPDFKLGVYFGWRWIFLGYTFTFNDLFHSNKKHTSKKEYELSIYSSKFGADFYYRKTGSNFKIKSYSGFDITPEERSAIDWSFNGLRSSVKGLNAYWIFNYKHFSYPAVYSQSTNQIKNAGSFMAGFTYSQHHYLFDTDQMPYIIQSQLNDAMKFNEVKYSNYSINFGYGYNWVFAKNCVLNASLLPAIGYKKSRAFTGNEDSTDQNILRFKWVENINFDLIGRAGVVWNNSKYFVGASIVTHSYDYRKDYFSLTNSYAVLRIYAGFNFLKKK